MLSTITKERMRATSEESRLLLGFETSDDAAVWQLTDDLAVVLTVDFFTPVVDDPYEFGRIAAANALSDIFAMGATPHVALNLLALDSSLGSSVAERILQGGADAVSEAGAIIAGGHTIDDDEPKYGLSVFGTIDPRLIVSNAGAQPGDCLYLTKPLGTGIISAALKIEAISNEGARPAIESMMELNKAASEAMLASNAHACTDVTGFGLAGHLHEMLAASKTSAVIDFSALPLFDEVWELSCAYCRPNRSFSIMDEAESYVAKGRLDDAEYDNRMGIMCDPQTSGGLLVALSEADAPAFVDEFERRTQRKPVCIGTVAEGDPGTINFSER